MFWAVARIFRRGLTVRRGFALGLVAAAGVATKGSSYGLLPGVALALIVALIRAPSEQRRAALYGAVSAAFAFVIPVAGLFAAYRWAWARPASAGASGGVPSGSSYYTGTAIREQLSYLWQFYLPRLPSMKPQFGSYPLWHVDFQGFIGRFGWFDYEFPPWAYNLALGVAGGVIALLAVALVRGRSALRGRRGELLCYVAMVLGLLFVIGIVGYRYRGVQHSSFEQARYLLPLLALYGAVIALAAKGAGMRFGRAVGAGLVILAMAQSLFALAITMHHYYG
jgi:hypothetical protein